MPRILTTFNPVVQPVENAVLDRPIKFSQQPLYQSETPQRMPAGLKLSLDYAKNRLSDKNGTRIFSMQPDRAGHCNFMGKCDAGVFCGPKPDTRRNSS
jgi:hypothetical protein